MSRLAVRVTLPCLFSVPLTFLMVQGFGIVHVWIWKCSTRSGDMKLSVALLSISTLTSEWRVYEWKVTRAWTEFLFGMNMAWGNNAWSMAGCCGLSKNPGQPWSFLQGGFLIDLQIICWSRRPNREHPLICILVHILGHILDTLLLPLPVPFLLW